MYCGYCTWEMYRLIFGHTNCIILCSYSKSGIILFSGLFLKGSYNFLFISQFPFKDELYSQVPLQIPFSAASTNIKLRQLLLKCFPMAAGELIPRDLITLF